MRLSTQFKITLLIFSLLLVVISASIVFTFQQVNRTRSQESLAYRIVQGAADLSYLSNDYVFYHGIQQLSQWETRYASFSDDVASLDVETVDQQALVLDIEANQQRMKTVFEDMVTTIGTSHNHSLDEEQTFPTLQGLWSRISIQTQTVASDGSRLAQLLRSEVEQLNTFSFGLILAIVSSFGAFLGVIYIQTFRRTLKSISELKAGAALIGSGNLDHKLNESKKDEIGELSESFNQMTTNLKNVTASKADLEREMAERKRAELQLREYQNNLEKLVEERTKQLKDAERLAAIGATAGMVGHDIRNPLQAITSDVYLAKADLASTLDSEEKKNVFESLDEIDKNIIYINKIVQDLQDFAKPIRPVAKETNLQRIVDDILAKNDLPSNIKIKFALKETVKVMADPDILKRILGNLVSNAVQAMPQGGKLSICGYSDSKDVVITVTDTGVGIPEGLRSKMFTPLFTTKSKGQGFGLAVVKRMTEALGGSVAFESEVGKGTKFIIRLPSQTEINGNPLDGIVKD